MEEVELSIQGEASGMFGAGEPGVLASVFGEAERREVPEGLARLARQLGLDPVLLESPGVWAMMEYRLTVR